MPNAWMPPTGRGGGAFSIFRPSLRRSLEIHVGVAAKELTSHLSDQLPAMAPAQELTAIILVISAWFGAVAGALVHFC